MKAHWLGRTVLVVTMAAGLSACSEDSRFKKVTDGISKDSVAVLSGGAVPHSIATYITEGKFWTVQFFAKTEVGAKDSLPWRAQTPVVYADDKVMGWGWSYWQKKAAELKVPLPPK